MAYRNTYTYLSDTFSGTWLHLMQSTLETLGYGIARISNREKAAPKGHQVKLPQNKHYALRYFS